MNRNKPEARQQMRQDIYAAIRLPVRDRTQTGRNLGVLNTTLTRHEVVEVLAAILASQIELIRDDARNRRTQ